MDDLHDALGRRLAVSSLAPCPVEFTAALVNLCSTQSCGKCTPCCVGLSALSDLLADVLEGRADESTLNLIERTARTIYLSSDCAIGYEAGAMALTAIRGFRDDFEHHIREHSCGFDREARVPCVSGCPAHVDIPGYISLVEAGRYADAVKVIRKNNPLPLVCGLVCEHPCEMHCRRGMVDDPMNILALKRFAVEHSDLNDYKPSVADNTGKRVAVIGGGPAGLSCAYYLAVMGHKVTIFEQRHHLGGMLRYGIPSYRLPRERLQAEVDWILSAGIDVELDHSVNGEELARLRDEFDAVYLAIGAHSDKKLGLPGEEAPGVESAVKMLRAIGDDELPDGETRDHLHVGEGVGGHRARHRDEGHARHRGADHGEGRQVPRRAPVCGEESGVVGPATRNPGYDEQQGDVPCQGGDYGGRCHACELNKPKAKIQKKTTGRRTVAIFLPFRDSGAITARTAAAGCESRKNGYLCGNKPSN